ncbi:PREDICTED: uncharacterized protein LOC107346853 isoform X2 [Acropora digitifera]|uniref:uncharacterized protein LOC107346853 isoform X2 n=1 Tax=Acropora digitifera TaxID=70779 RepID=UPI00077B10F4|nr:PREDICTED: uncharacterized protein LOC107346853 isoform X2 [Acropora digitifera]
MWQSRLRDQNNSKSPGTSVHLGAAVERRDEKSSETKSKEGFEPSILECTTNDGLNMRCVSLANHEMVPSNFEKLDFLENGKDAKRLFKKYTAERASEAIAEGRGKKNKGAPASLIAALGSNEEIYSVGADCGLFAAVFTAYSHHYKLRTSPDDWWFCVIKQVAEAIDRSAQQESVRKMFVNHEGKRSIEVAVDDPTIYTVNYSWLFDQIAKGIKENIKVPEFVDGMTGDFCTTTPVQKIVSQITLMCSMKEYFDFGLLCGCGIPAVEMLGSEEDWRKLTSKLKVLRTLLEPIENDLRLPSRWWDVVQKVFNNLLETYQGKPDEKWWSHIVDYQEQYASGMFPTGKNYIRGWITEFLEGASRHRSLFEHKDFSTGLVTVPLNLKHPSGAQDTAALAAGMLGFTVHRTDTSNEVTVQPFQGWALMLANDSPFL